jgi:D-3-phosphoglycerate dehydrogenase
MTLKVLISAPYMQPVLEQFTSWFDGPGQDIELVVPQVNERLSEEELLGLISEIDGVICGDDAFTEKVMLAAPRLKVISKWGTGIDSIDQKTAKRLGIAVCNTADAFTHPVADSVLGYMLCFARRIPWMDRDIRAGNWIKPMGFSLREATLGIIGIGNVGRAVAHRSAGFGMKILGNDLLPIPVDVVAETGLLPVDKQALLEQADFVSLNCDLNPTSRHIIGSPELALMKTSAYLINTARGPLVDEFALVDALKSGGIAGAGLDVFEGEPLPKESGLLQLDNCLIAPHNANSSPEAYQRVHENTIRNLLDHLSSGDRA